MTTTTTYNPADADRRIWAQMLEIRRQLLALHVMRVCEEIKIEGLSPAAARRRFFGAILRSRRLSLAMLYPGQREEFEREARIIYDLHADPDALAEYLKQ